MTTHRAAEVMSMLGHPSAIEEIAADYPDYEIYRQRRGTHHGGWIARRDGAEVRADTPAELRQMLAEAAR